MTRNRITLYIGGRSVDMDSQSFVLFNYTQDDLTNPAIVRNSYSQQLTIPATPANNDLFDHFGQLDRITAEAGFGLLRKTPFSIFSETGELLESGYVRMDGVTREKGRNKSYKVTLFGDLGSLFYGYAFGVDGTPLSLGCLTIVDPELTDYPPDTEIPLDLSEFWGAHGFTGEFSGIINFAPTYAGYPEEFDAGKAIISPNLYANVPSSIYKDSTRYVPMGGIGQPYIINFAGEKYDLEVGEFRAYLMRPVINVNRLLRSIEYCSSEITGKSLVIDGSVYSIVGEDVIWMTLPTIKPEYRGASITLEHLLEGTVSPAAFIIGFAKAFGLVFHTDHDTITMMTRDAWYSRSSDVLDLTERVDIGSIELSPVFADAHFFDFSIPGLGYGAEQKKKASGRELGSLLVDTGYIYNDTVEDVLDGTPFKVADEPRLQSRSFIVSAFKTNNAGTGVEEEYLPQTSYEVVTAHMYKYESGRITEEAQDLPLDSMPSNIAQDMYNFLDWNTRPELCGDDMKPQDGSGVLLYYNGFVNTPAVEYDGGDYIIDFPAKKYWLTVYDAVRIALNDGMDCWDMRHSGRSVTALPEFSYVAAGGTAADSLRMDGGEGIYARRWKKYITDLYDQDTYRMTCRVNLRGMQVGQELLGRFWWYGGSLWVLNRINNHSLATDDLTECEFIRIKDTEDYTNGQQ